MGGPAVLGSGMFGGGAGGGSQFQIPQGMMPQISQVPQMPPGYSPQGVVQNAMAMRSAQNPQNQPFHQNLGAGRPFGGPIADQTFTTLPGTRRLGGPTQGGGIMSNMGSQFAR